MPVRKLTGIFFVRFGHAGIGIDAGEVFFVNKDLRVCQPSSVLYLTGKIFFQRIERNNLMLRTRIKRLASKTLCFSRSVEVHGEVIGAFIKKYIFH